MPYIESAEKDTYGDAVIRIENLSIDLGEFHLRDLNLSIGEDEYMVLLGPTGVGKTVLIECIVGIYRPRSGRVLIDGRDVSALYPEQRNVAYVPQDYALFPNMTVAQNLAYGLKARRRPAAEIESKVEAMMDILGITYLRSRLPLNLSGGEKQRAALGRALVTEPRVVLLDEPLSALDENMRCELTMELRRIHEKLKGTFLHVCHNFDEAAEVAQRAAIMNDGTVVQIGTIDDIVYRPASEFVARFTRTRNIFFGDAQPDSSGSIVTINNRLRLCSGRRGSGRVMVAIRPEKIQIVKSQEPSVDNLLSGRVVRRTPKLNSDELEVDVGVILVVLVDRTREPETFSPGREIHLYIPPESVHLISRPQ